MSNQHYRKAHKITMLATAVSFSLIYLTACVSSAGAPKITAEIAEKRAVPEVATVEMATPNPGPPDPLAAYTSHEFNCADINQIPAEECQALVALYDSTDGANWVDNSGWLDSNRVCTWFGITCTGGHVSHIDLFHNQLAGTLPPELSDLSNLRVINMWGNQLHGSIPAALGDLSELVSLVMSSNNFSGSLPAEIGNLLNLRFLTLAYNQIGGQIPPTLSKLENLDSLDLSYNSLEGTLPAEIGNMTNLTQLRLSHNQLSGAIPDSFASLKGVYELDLSYNLLSGYVPESVLQIEQHMLWGNNFEGTITSDGRTPITVAFKGVHFTADPSLAASIWPEVKPAGPIPDPESFSIFYASPEHIRFTFSDPDLSPRRMRMGINLAAEAQVLVYPLEALAEAAPWAPAQIETLKGLLAQKGQIPAGDLPLLPITNSAQVFHAQAQYLVSENIHGLRFISQHSQDPLPYILSQELFYTFQGFTADESYYLAAFFPVDTSVIPETRYIENWQAFQDNYDTYLSETAAVLDRLPPAEFVPDLSLLDNLIMSLQVESPIALPAVDSTPGAVPLKDPPVGLIYRATDGLWRIEAGGGTRLLTSEAGALPSPDGTQAVFIDEKTGLWLLDLVDGSKRHLLGGTDLSGFYEWGDAHTLLLGLWLAPEEREGVAVGHVATLDIGSGELRVIDGKYLSLGRPAISPDGQRVAYDISPFYPNVSQNGWLFHRDGNSTPFDRTQFSGLEEERALHLFNPSWSPDGSRLAWLGAGEEGTSLLVFDLEGQAALQAHSWQPAQFGALPPTPVWSPDGKWLAVDIWARDAAKSGLWLVAADGESAQRLSATSTAFATGNKPVWLSSHELNYVECDENFSGCENRLFDLLTGTTWTLELPTGSVVLLVPSRELTHG